MSDRKRSRVIDLSEDCESDKDDIRLIVSRDNCTIRLPISSWEKVERRAMSTQLEEEVDYNVKREKRVKSFNTTELVPVNKLLKPLNDREGSRSIEEFKQRMYSRYEVAAGRGEEERESIAIKKVWEYTAACMEAQTLVDKIEESEATRERMERNVRIKIMEFVSTYRNVIAKENEMFDDLVRVEEDIHCHHSFMQEVYDLLVDTGI